MTRKGTRVLRHYADFMHGWVMLAFYALVILLGWLSYAYFERPLQSLIRGKARRAALSAS